MSLATRIAPALAFALLTSTLGAGCVATPEAYAKRSAKLTCKDQEKCHPDEFHAAYSDQAACRDDAENTFNDLAKIQEDAGCEYQAKYARKCLREARKQVGECSDQPDVSEDCMKVWDCPSASQLGLDDDEIETLRTELEETAPEHIDPWSAAMLGLER